VLDKTVPSDKFFDILTIPEISIGRIWLADKFKIISKFWQNTFSTVTAIDATSWPDITGTESPTPRFPKFDIIFIAQLLSLYDTIRDAILTCARKPT